MLEEIRCKYSRRTRLSAAHARAHIGRAGKHLPYDYRIACWPHKYRARAGISAASAYVGSTNIGRARACLPRARMFAARVHVGRARMSGARAYTYFTDQGSV